MAGYTSEVRLKFFCGDKREDEIVHLLLVSTSQTLLEQLQKCLHSTKSVETNRPMYNMRTHIAKNIGDVLIVEPNLFTIDFIIFIVDVQNSVCLKEVKSNVELLEQSYPRERICLVNPHPNFNSVVKPSELWDLAEVYQFNVINGHLMDEENSYLASRILNLVEASCALLNGMGLVGLV